MAIRLGNDIIKASGSIRGFRVGNIRVQNGAELRLGGLMIGNVIVETGATLVMDGCLIGNIIRCGGQATINGFVMGGTLDGTALGKPTV